MRAAPLVLVLLTACPPGAEDKPDTAATTPCVDSPLPVLTLSETEIDFDRVPLATSVTEVVVLANDGDHPLGIDAIAIGDGERGADYTVAWDVATAACVIEESVDGTDVLVLAPGCELPLSVTYTATTPGGFQDALVVESWTDSGTFLADPIHGQEVVWLSGVTEGTPEGDVYNAGNVIDMSQTAMVSGETIDMEVRAVSPGGMPIHVDWATDEGSDAFGTPDAQTTTFTAPAVASSGQNVNIYAITSDDGGQDWIFARVAVYPTGTALYDCDDVE